MATQISAGWLVWPRSAWIFLAGLLAVYGPTLFAAEQVWQKNGYFAHGFFIFPISAFLVYMMKDDLAKVRQRPSSWGLPLLALGLAIVVAATLLQVRFIGIWSLLITLTGLVLLLHGPAMLRMLAFPIGYLFFAGAVPRFLFKALSDWVQTASTIGAFRLCTLIGIHVTRTGNILALSNSDQLEVADACSGFKKLIALFAFSLLYVYLYQVAPWKRALLIVSTIPIALVANVVRISGLVAVTVHGGVALLHKVHDSADLLVMVIAIALFLALGRLLGCKTHRFAN